LTNRTAYHVQDKHYKSTISFDRQRIRGQYTDTETNISNFHDNTACRFHLRMLVRSCQGIMILMDLHHDLFSEWNMSTF